MDLLLVRCRKIIGIGVVEISETRVATFGCVWLTALGPNRVRLATYLALPLHAFSVIALFTPH